MARHKKISEEMVDGVLFSPTFKAALLMERDDLWRSFKKRKKTARVVGTSGLVRAESDSYFLSFSISHSSPYANP